MPRERVGQTRGSDSANVVHDREWSREVGWRPAIETVFREVHHAIRSLLSSPAFTLAGVITLALGIGATTAVFSVIQQVMLRSLPVANPHQLWRIGDSASCCTSAGYKQDGGKTQNDWSLFSWEAYKLFRANTPEFVDLAAFQLGERNAELAVRRSDLSTPVQPRNGEYVSGNFFRTFAVSPWRGRLFTEADDREGSMPVAVMSFHTWQEQYGADPSVLGAPYEINGHAFTVIGITPPRFYGAKLATQGMPDFWLPLTTEPMMAGAASRLKDPASAWLALTGRVRPGTDVKALQAQLRGRLLNWLASNVQSMNEEEKGLWREQTLTLTPGGAGVSLVASDSRSGLLLLQLASLCVLLLACVNLANLLLTRGLRNRLQYAVRVALGSPRGRLLRKTLVESVALAIMGGTAGVGVAWAGVRIMLNLAHTRSPLSSWIPVQASPSLPVLLFALTVSIATGIIFGVAPAWITSRTEPIEAMRGANRATGTHRHWVYQTPMILQVAVSMVLLSVAAMLGQSVLNQENQNLGFTSTDRYLVSIDPQASGIPEARLVMLFQQIEARLRQIPGVRSVGAVQEAPPGGWVSNDIVIEGQPEPGSRTDVSSGWTRVTPGFFPTYGIKFTAGRPITDEDGVSTRSVAVVNEAFATKFFGRKNPIGQHFGPLPEIASRYEIVGVATNVAFNSELAGPMYFLPEAQSTQSQNKNTESQEAWSHYLRNIAIWAPGSPPDLEKRVMSALGEVDPDLMVYGIESYEDVMRDASSQQNLISTLTRLFGAIGLVLTAVGLYGVTSYGVEQRTSEIGVRMALGADRRSVFAIVLRRAFAQVTAGIGLGIPAAIGVGHLMASELFGVEAWNPALLGGASLSLATVAFIATWLPARRAARVDPLQALRDK
jgi:putative ABC transport system permease protein